MGARWPARDRPALVESCALDVASEGQHTLTEVGLYVQLTRERVRQIQRDALEHVRRQLARRGLEFDALFSSSDEVEVEKETAARWADRIG